MVKKINSKTKDNYLHGILFELWQSCNDDDLPYYEIFYHDIYDSKNHEPIRATTELLFYTSKEIKILKKFEDKTFSYKDMYVCRDLYPLHYLVFSVFEELFPMYSLGRGTCGYRGENYCEYMGREIDILQEYLPNNSSFSRIKKKYIEIIRRLSKEIEGKEDIGFLFEPTDTTIRDISKKVLAQ